jgi:hypothetical protein
LARSAKLKWKKGKMAIAMLTFIVVLCLLDSSYSFAPSSARFLSSALFASKEELDNQGYIIKPRDWFNGLSGDPGASLTDPRAVPPEMKAFAERIQNGGDVESFAETIRLIDANYDYFAVPFQVGDVKSAANTNVGSAKIFSFGLMTKMDVKATLRLFGEISRDLTPDGTDHPNIRAFIKNGWSGVTFVTGLAIISKLQAFDDTDSAYATQISLEGEGEWDAGSDSWMP